MSIVVNYLGQLLHHSEFRKRKKSIVFISIFILVSYGSYFGLNREMAILLALEDGLFEYLTSILFLAVSFLFIKVYFSSRNLFFLALSLVFMVGCGEEISWGQRLLGFEGPQSLVKQNIQNEFNLHNLDFFHPQDKLGVPKRGIEKLITVDFLYNMFWLTWAIIIPFATFLSSGADLIMKKIKFPVPPLSIGITFLINFMLFIIIRSFVLSSQPDIFYMKIREVYECCTAAIFLTVALAFYLNRKKRQQD